MRNQRFLISIIFLILTVFPVAGEIPRVLNGVLDLSSYDLSEPVALKGNWKFRSLEPGDSLDWQFMTVPSAWNDTIGSAFSSGEYVLDLIVPIEEDKKLAIKIPHFNESVDLFVNGELFFSSGNFERGEAAYSQSIITLPSSSNILEIRIRFKNSFFRLGGFHRSIVLGYQADLQKAYAKDIIFEGMILGSLLIIALFNLFLLFNKLPQNYSIFLGLSALFYAIRGMLSEPLCFPAFYGVSNIAFFYRLEYFVSYMGTAIMMPFLANIASWDSSFKRKIYKILLTIYLISAIISMFVPLDFLSSSVYFYQLCGLSCMIFGLWVTFPGRVKKDIASHLIFLGAIIFLLLVSMDIMALNFLSLPFKNITQFGMLIFIIPLGFAISIRISNTYKRAEILSKELEKEVAVQTRELQKSNKKLKELSITDPLTGIKNRRSFFEQAELNIKSCRQRNKPLSLMALDIDFFKKINDTYGHKKGDDTLCFFTSLCESMIRQTDLLARVGGEEFAILLPSAELSSAREIAERIRRELEVQSSSPDSPVPPLTVSIGLVCLEKDETITQAVERADALLYKAKESGRNQVQS